MKKIFLGMTLIAVMALPVVASIGGGKKKSKKKAKTECKLDKKCDKKGDPKCCDLSNCTKDTKCSTSSAEAGKK